MQRYQDSIILATGQAVQAAAVQVLTYPAGAVATIYSDNSGTVTTNPLITDGNGHFAFYAADGRYSLSITKVGIAPIITSDILLEDPADGSAALSASSGASLVGFLPSGTGAVTDTVQGALRNGIVSVMYFIPTASHAAIKAGTYLSNLSVYIQAGIDAISAAGGGILFFPYGVFYANVTLKAGVFLVGRFKGRGDVASYGATSNPIISAFATGTVIDTPVAATGPCGIIGIGVTGFGSGTIAKGIRFRSVAGGIVSDVSFNNFTNEALLVDSGSLDCRFIDILATNTLLNRAIAVKTGCIDIHGTDHYLYNVRGNTGQSADLAAKSSANLYLCGILLRAANCDAVACKGELSDVGIRNTGTFNRWTSPRADHNYGHGIENTADGTWTNGLSYDNSQDTTNTYDGWSVSGVNGQYVNCLANSDVAKVHRYGFQDSSAAGDANKNRYLQPYSAGHGTATFNSTNTGAVAVRFATGPQKTLANSATPSVDGYENFATNGAVLTITDFLNGVDGQVIAIACNDANTTIQHNGSTIYTSTGTNKKLNTVSIYRFLKWGTSWVEIAEKEWRGSATYDPPSLADGAGTTTTVTVTGAVLGDLAVASFSLDLQGITLTAWVSAADTVSIRFQNESGGVLDLASGTLRARVFKV